MTSFEFKFDNSKKPATGKVFAVKRKAAANNNFNASASLGTSINKSNKLICKSGEGYKINKKGGLKKKVGVDKNKASVHSKGEKIFIQSTLLVKRKKKKDKQEAKALRAEGDDAATDNPNTVQNKTHSLFSEKYKTLYVNTNTEGKSIIEKVFSRKNFSDLDIHRHLVSNLEKINFITVTNVQEKSIPSVMAGKNVLIRSQTGSGKTLAYAIPIMDALQGLNPRLQRSDGVQAIIVVPTRELALQTHELFGKINTFQWIVVGHLCGGENRKTEKVRLRKGVHVLIGTPGRLLDHILHTAAFKTDNVRCLVLDEADRLLDMGFKKDIVKLVEDLDRSKTNTEYNPLEMLKGKSPKDEQQEVLSENISPLKNPSSKSRQTILLSATLSKGIAELAEFTMKDHEYIDALDEAATVNPQHMVIPDTVKQEFIVTYVKHRLFTLSALLVAKSKQNSKVFVFMATSQMVDYHYELFTRCLVKMPVNRGKLKSGDVVLLDDMEDEDSDEEEVVLKTKFFKLHGNMDQSSRKEVFTGFRAAKGGVLLCTDVAARGIDVPAADCIIQYNGPQSDDDYIHRVGRTGRAGKFGSAIIFLTHEEQEYISRLQEHKVFLKELKPEDLLKYLCDLMEEPDHMAAATALQKRYENCLAKDKDLHRKACFAYSSWSRFYNTYPSALRSIFDFKKVNLGHYVTSFGLRDTPTTVARVIKGQVTKTTPQRLNKKLSIHEDGEPGKPQQKRKIKSISLTTSEFSSGLKPSKKRKVVK